ncbi:MFS transporter [Sediminibacillus albus]|uniref:DUF4129 domain-containing protein n=1 Tax=Sediminibacillus albus TaxID=407036 RepID=A0A1G8WDT7_9BACI|nr:MFS transporter [Sediminibacillus albus]SDJ76424.1 hypothetical protein SAMN05216243_0731 [Sediminibacillus albus]
MNYAERQITRIYQFTSEAILVYLLLIPLLWLLDITVCFWSFLMLIGIQVIGTTIIARFSTVMYPFILWGGLLVMAAVSLFNMPYWLAGLIAAVFGWRFIKHQQDADHRHEKSLLALSFFLIAVYLLMDSNPVFLWIAIVQFVFMLSGYLLRNIMSMERGRGFSLHFIWIIFGVFTALGVAIAFLFNGFRVGYLFIGNLLTSALGGILGWIFRTTEIEPNYKQSDTDGSQIVQDGSNRSDDGPEVGENFDGEVVNQVLHAAQWVLTIAVIVAATLILLSIYKRRIEVDRGAYRNIEIANESLPESLKKKKRWFSKTRVNRPSNPIRKLFLDFEIFAEKLGFGRRAYETVEDWFNRLQLPVNDVVLYQRVRYGEEELSVQEEKTFRKEIQELTNILKDQSTDTN